MVLSKPVKSNKPSQPINVQPLGNISQSRVWVPPVETVEPVDRGGGNPGPSGSHPRMQQPGSSWFSNRREGYNSSSTESDDENNAHSLPRQPPYQGHSRLESSDADHARRLDAMLNYVEHQKQCSESEGKSNSRPGGPSVRPNAMNNRQKQLEALRKMEEKLRETIAKKQSRPAGTPESNLPSLRQRDLCSQMQLHVLDISNVVEGQVSWRPIQETFSIEAPDETTFYSLVEGRGELVMFGGIQRDIQSMLRGVDLRSNLVSNILYILSPLKNSI